MLAAHIDSLLFLLLIGAAALMRWLTKKAGDSSDQEAENEATPPAAQRPPPLPRQETQTDEERIRKFLEALGQPTSSQPPARVRPRANPPVVSEIPDEPSPESVRPAQRRNILNPLPPLTTTPAALPRRVTLPRQASAPSLEPRISQPAPRPAPIFEVQSNAPAAMAPAPVPNPLEAYAVAAPTATPPGTKVELISLLRTPQALRQAIILREIFGPPRSLQPFEGAGNL
jgi:hypothetical protein